MIKTYLTKPIKKEVTLDFFLFYILLHIAVTFPANEYCSEFWMVENAGQDFL